MKIYLLQGKKGVMPKKNEKFTEIYLTDKYLTDKEFCDILGDGCRIKTVKMTDCPLWGDCTGKKI